MPIPITAAFLNILNIGSGVITSLIATKIWSNLDKDLEKVIFKLIQEQNKEFKTKYPDVVLELNEKEMRHVIFSNFGNLTATQLEKPLSQEKIELLFVDLFLIPRERESGQFEDINPKYQKELVDRSEDFLNQFKRKAESAFMRNSAAATTVLLNSLVQSGKNDEEILEILQEINSKQSEDVVTILSDVVQVQLVPAIKKQIQTEFNRFQDDWQFILRSVKMETSKAEEDEKEWLEQLAQVLEWKDFKNIERINVKNVSGQLFKMEKIDEFGQVDKYLCWGCPKACCPEEMEVRLAISNLLDFKSTKFFVITRAELNGAIKKIFEDKNIKPQLTLENFVRTLLDISKHQTITVSGYERQPICQQYIDILAHSATKNEIDIRKHFYDWLESETILHISMLGNFGTGKTEFCKRMQWEMLKNYNPAKPSRIPIIITLREQKGLRLEQMIDSIMNQMGLKQIDYLAFRTLNRMGLFVILIDGFDEMGTHASVDEMISNFQNLAVLAEDKAKVIITSRTHYFEHQQREKEVLSLPEFIEERPEFHVLYLNPFTREQIETYLDKVKDLRKPKQDVLAKMDEHPELKDLMQTPVLLDMILKIFPDLMEAEENITISLIYEKATSRWVINEKKKGHIERLSEQQVLQFMQDLAWQMHKEDILSINYKKLRSHTYQNFKKSMTELYELDAFYSEIRTCTFLTRDSLGDYKFAHKSFMEYFTACFLAPFLLKDKTEKIKINDEIRQFIHYSLKPEINYETNSLFQFNGKSWEGMKKCDKHPNCFIHLKDNSEMVWIPPGPFIASEGSELCIRQLEKGAFLDKYLVTNEQYARFLNEIGNFDNKWLKLEGSYKNEKCRIVKQKNEFVVQDEYENNPVNFVSFYGAEAYAQWAGKELPSEKLWEKAGRGIDGRIYSWGDNWHWDNCNSAERWAKKDLSKYEDWSKWNDSEERLKAKITPVNLFSEYNSPFGCNDLSGNLWEWMIDFWEKGGKTRVLRGGAFFDDRDFVRLAYRDSGNPQYMNDDVGFRLSRTF